MLFAYIRGFKFQLILRSVKICYLLLSLIEPSQHKIYKDVDLIKQKCFK